MKIRRAGSKRYVKYSSIELKAPCYSWNTNKKVICFEQNNVKDFTSKSNHDYKVEMELSEIAEVLDLIASDVLVNSRQHLIQELSPATVRLLKILAVLASAPDSSDNP